MAGLTGDFDLNGRTFHFEIVTIYGEDGSEITGPDLEDDEDENAQQADRVIYVVTDPNGEEFHRWLSGPFESIGDIEAAIVDEIDTYESVEG